MINQLKNNTKIKVISLLSAILLWLYVMIFVDPSENKLHENVPVTISNMRDLNDKDLCLIFEVLETEIRKDDINLEIAAIKKHKPLTQTGISDYQCKIEKKIENVQAFLKM